MQMGHTRLRNTCISQNSACAESSGQLVTQPIGDHAMRRFRFHLGTLVILVLLLGVGFAALRESNEIWDSSIFSITLGASIDLDPARHPSN